MADLCQIWYKSSERHAERATHLQFYVFGVIQCKNKHIEHYKLCNNKLCNKKINNYNEDINNDIREEINSLLNNIESTSNVVYNNKFYTFNYS